jgi:hypothetical protein
MKRTLGIAVLVSMMLVPHGGTTDHRSWSDPFGRGIRQYYSYHAPFWDSQGYPVLVSEFILQTIFVGVAAVFIMNIPWRKRWVLEFLGWLSCAVGLVVGLGLVGNARQGETAGYMGAGVIVLSMGLCIYW